MLNQLPTTGKHTVRASLASNYSKSESESDCREREGSIRSLNYTRKSSRDLLNRVLTRESEQKSFKLVLQQSILKHPLIQTERQRQRQRVSEQLPSARPLRSSINFLHKTILNRGNNKLTNTQLFCQKSKDIATSKAKQSVIPIETLVQVLIQQFEQNCQRHSVKLTDRVHFQAFQQTINNLSGMKKPNICRVIWDEMFQERDTNWLSILSFLVALLGRSIEPYMLSGKVCIDIPDQKETRVQKRKIIIKKSFSRPKSSILEASRTKLGEYSHCKNCLVFSSSQIEKISASYDCLKTQLMNKTRQKVKANESKQKENAIQRDSAEEITIKVHLKNQLASMKVNKHQDPILIAKRFAAKQRLDKQLESKLCFFLTKELKNVQIHS